MCSYSMSFDRGMYDLVILIFLRFSVWWIFRLILHDGGSIWLLFNSQSIYIAIIFES